MATATSLCAETRQSPTVSERRALVAGRLRGPLAARATARRGALRAAPRADPCVPPFVRLPPRTCPGAAGQGALAAMRGLAADFMREDDWMLARAGGESQALGPDADAPGSSVFPVDVETSTLVARLETETARAGCLTSRLQQLLVKTVCLSRLHGCLRVWTAAAARSRYLAVVERRLARKQQSQLRWRAADRWRRRCASSRRTRLLASLAVSRRASAVLRVCLDAWGGLVPQRPEEDRRAQDSRSARLRSRAQGDAAPQLQLLVQELSSSLTLVQQLQQDPQQLPPGQRSPRAVLSARRRLATNPFAGA